MSKLKRNKSLKDLFQKETFNTISVSSPVKGETISLVEVNDEMFSKKMMGDGIGIKPIENSVHAPFDGEIVMVFPSKHALGIKHKSQIEFLIHIGIDTVNLDGEGFTSHVKQGKKVKKGDLLVTFDSNYISEKGYDTTVLVVCTKCNEYDLKTSEAKKAVDLLTEIMILRKQE